MSSVQILLTGFEPFKQEKINPSKEIVLRLGPQAGIDFLILPVSYERSVAEIDRCLQQKQYDYVIMLGEAGKRVHICLEKTAVNCIDATISDEDGVESSRRNIRSDGVEQYQTQLALQELFQALSLKGHPVEISDSAGTYVCNHLYYRVLEKLERHGVRTKALFVHVPYLPEQTIGKPSGTPSLPLAVMTTTIEALLEGIRSSAD